MSDPRIRFEGALETVERAVIEAERTVLRLQRENTRGLVQVLQQLDEAEPAREKVERFVAESPAIKPLLARFASARKAIATRVQREAEFRAYVPGALIEHAALLESEQVFFQGSVFSWGYWVMTGFAVSGGLFLFFSELAQGKREFVFLGFVALAPLFYFPAFRRAVELRVTSLSLRIGAQTVAVRDVARVDVIERRGRGPYFFATIVDTSGKEREPVRLSSLPDGFVDALGKAGVKVELTRR